MSSLRHLHRREHAEVALGSLDLLAEVASGLYAFVCRSTGKLTMWHILVSIFYVSYIKYLIDFSCSKRQNVNGDSEVTATYRIRPK